jgi:serine/threonine protein kinase/formylglycine-generating enzyme required for sulfatase activity
MDDATLSMALFEAAQRLQRLGGPHAQTAHSIAQLSDALKALRLNIPATHAVDGAYDTFDPDLQPDLGRHATMVEDPALLAAALAARPDGDTVHVAGHDLPPPNPQINRLEPGVELGRGGMGRIVEAFDPLLQRRVAVKFLLEPQKVTPRRLSRFIAEAQITAQLDHPNIVPIHEFGLSEAGDVYLIMKRVRGRSLHELVLALRLGDKQTRAEWDRHKLLRAFWYICQALAYAHGRGVLHRDLKPDNIMLGDFGEVYVMDWGVAKVMGQPELLPELSAAIAPSFTPSAQAQSSRHSLHTQSTQHSQIRRIGGPSTLDGASIGTPGYMSPEQTEGHFEQLTPASDIWSLGAILYELLTLLPAFDAPSAMEVIIKAASYTTPPDPSAVALADPIPQELAQICTKALAHAPADRYRDALALAQAIESFLDGSNRRAAAEQQLEAALRRWVDFHALDRAHLRAQAAADTLRGFFAPHTSREEKAPLLALQDQLDDLNLQRARAQQDTINACERALSQDPNHIPSRKLLTEVYWHRLHTAEATRDRAAAHLHAGRIALYGAYSDRMLLEGTGRLSLATSPAGAAVMCQRIRRQGLTWTLEPGEALGVTPLSRVPLPMGAYLLTITHPADGAVTCYPIHITRTHHWDAGTLPLLTAAEVGEGFVYVPEGPYLRGGDPAAIGALPADTHHLAGFLISARPVSVSEYLAFLNDVAASEGFEAAWARAPRHTPAGGQRWPLPADGAPISVPRVDDDGDLWDPTWPITSISWNDALTFCRWRSARDGVPYTLPTEDQWEKAARGVDGRAFPWGDRFDATLCKMRLSRAGRPTPEPIAAFPTDRSPYGVLDMAGSTRDWCVDPSFNGDPDRRTLRGGSWLDEPYQCRLASRIGMPPWLVSPDIGFRLVKKR